MVLVFFFFFFLAGTKSEAERVVQNATYESLPKAKTSKFDLAYVALGFTVTAVGNKQTKKKKDRCVDSVSKP